MNEWMNVRRKKREKTRDMRTENQRKTKSCDLHF